MLNVEMFETKDSFFTVIVGGKFASMLTRDEALGVIASALFGRGSVIFVRTYEETVSKSWLFGGEIKTPIALLPEK